MTEARTCSRCGAKLPKDSHRSHCLPCLLQLGLQSAEGLDEEITEGSSPTASGPAEPSGSILAENPGDRIGHYKLLQQIGEGGCGVVYMAEQEEPIRRRVAFKVIKLGMDTQNVIARFQAERQALAMMDHPNIAKVLDAGATPTGRPYFVMELVRGVKITTYCDEQKLSTPQRLDLFLQVCQAIQHAHQKGIIHRDIKPSNILVTEQDGAQMPKIIDFGIAKATTDQRLTDKTLFTAFEQFIGTPAYMSPEQAGLGGLDVDTRSDIYSLGVLLYELLTGKPPFDSETLARSALDEILRVIREHEPPRPSTRVTTLTEVELTKVAQRRQIESTRLPHLLRGDLDWIVMKALDKDRRRRYETANGLASDIQRHLNNEPVVACPPSNLYRFQKMVHRNKLAVGAGAAIAGALIIGLAIALWQAIEKSRAEREQSRLRKEAEAQRNKAQSEAAKSRQVAQFLAEIFGGVGPSIALGRDTTVLKEILARAAERIGNEFTNQPEVEIGLRSSLAEAYRDLELYQEEMEMARRSMELARARFPAESAPAAEALFQMGTALNFLGQSKEAEVAQRESVRIWKKLLEAQPEGSFGANNPPGGNLENLCNSLTGLGHIYYIQADYPRMEMTYREALALARKLPGNNLRLMALLVGGLGQALGEQGKLDEAESRLREALETQRKLAGGKDHPSVARSLSNLALVLKRQDKLDQAESMYFESLEMSKRIFGAENREIVTVLHNLAALAQSQKRWEVAESRERDVIAMARKLGDDALVAWELNWLSDLLVDAQKLEAAQQAVSEALALRRKLPDQDVDVANVLANLASILERQGKIGEAEPQLRECLAIREAKIPHNWRTFNTRSLLGASLMAQGRYADAEPLLLSGYEGMKQREATKERLRQAIQRIVRLYEQTGRPAQMAEWNRKLADLEEAGKKVAPPR